MKELTVDDMITRLVNSHTFGEKPCYPRISNILMNDDPSSPPFKDIVWKNDKTEDTEIVKLITLDKGKKYGRPKTKE